MKHGFSVWATDIGDLYDRIKSGKAQNVPLDMYIRALREGHPDRRSSVCKIENGKRILIKGIRNHHHTTGSGRGIKIYYALDEGVFRVCELGKVRFIRCHDGIIEDIDEETIS